MLRKARRSELGIRSSLRILGLCRFEHFQRRAPSALVKLAQTGEFGGGGMRLC